MFSLSMQVGCRWLAWLLVHGLVLLVHLLVLVLLVVLVLLLVLQAVVLLSELGILVIIQGSRMSHSTWEHCTPRNGHDCLPLGVFSTKVLALEEI